MRYSIYLFILLFSLSACNSEKMAMKEKEASKTEMTEEEKRAALIEEMKNEKNPNEVDEAYQKVQQGIADSAVVRLQKTACFGRCPIYTFTIYESGYVEYFGKKWVDKEGLFSTQVSPEQMVKLIAKANEMGFFDLNNVYDNEAVTDLPSVITSIRKDGELKTVINRFDGPQVLRNFEQEIEDFANSLLWSKVMEK